MNFHCFPFTRQCVNHLIHEPKFYAVLSMNPILFNFPVFPLRVAGI